MSARLKPANCSAKPLTGRFAGMRRIPSGSFAMGAEGFYADEAPVRRIPVDGFWIDETPVTNAQFARFIAATGYVTQAEVAPDPVIYPGLDPALAKPASIVFVPPAHPVDLKVGVAVIHLPCSNLAARD